MTSIPLLLAGLLGLGGPEVLIIFAVLLLLFGGSKLPELARGLGKSIKEFKHASKEDSEIVSTAAMTATTPRPAQTVNAEEAAHP